MPSPAAVCVTGGAGFIGSHLAEAFLALGRPVIVLDDLSTGDRRNVPPGAELRVLDIRSRDAAELLAAGEVELLVHQAAQMDVRRSVADPSFDADVNVCGSLNLLEGAIRGGVTRVIFASTGGAIYGDQEPLPATEDLAPRPLSPYGVSKLAVEHYLYYYHAAHGLDVTCLRYANVYGERQSSRGEAGVVAIFLDRLLSGRQPTINGDGRQTRDYVYVGDVVRANLAAADAGGYRTYNVGTGIETSVLELYRQLSRAVGSAAEAAFGPAKPGEQQRSSVDASKLRRELGIGEPVPLAEGLSRTAGWFRDRIADR